MPIEMPRGLPFSVDTWTPSSQRKRHHFLTHAHRDHSVGIATASYPIYSTRMTKSLVLQHFPQLDCSCFLEIEVGQSMVINDPDGIFTVTAYDANHCPGAVMFLFEGEFGNVLHTGDCRLTPECLKNLPEKFIGRKGREPSCPLDFVYLDCTFGKYSQKIPSKQSAVRQVINCIWKHPEAQIVYLTCDLLGQEDILAEVSRTFGSKIYVDKKLHPGFYKAITLTFPDILSNDSSSRFHLFDGFPKLTERAKAKIEEARANSLPEPLIIRPSTQWYACEEEYSQADIKLRQKFYEAVQDQFGIWHVCYSIHSSREELEWALQLLAPKWVVSTTPNCWAMELNYVKKNCLASKIPPSDPLWKLLDISFENTDSSESCEAAGFSLTPVVATQTHTYITGEVQTQPREISVSWKEFVNLSPPSKRPNLTLFGRARVANLDEDLQSTQEVKSTTFLKEETIQDIANNEQGKGLSQKTAVDEKVTEVVRDVSVEDKHCKRSSYSPVGLSKSFHENMRKLYRTMNVPVPQPLPSLVELNASRRRVKRSIL